jgi:hypothetical protein
MSETTTGSPTVAPEDRAAYLTARGWRTAAQTFYNSPLYHDPFNPDEAPLLPGDAFRRQLARDKGDTPTPEVLLMSSLPSSSVVVQQLPFPSPDPTGACRGHMVLVLAEEVPALVARLGLKADELFSPASGSAAGRPTLVVGAACPSAYDSDNRSSYAAERSYPVREIAEQTRRFSRPRQLQTEKELQEIRVKAARDEVARQDYERHRRREQDEAARVEAQKRSSPFWRIKELERQMAALLGLRPPE